MQNEKHYLQRSNWLRAAVLGANDGILSTSSIIISVAAAGTDHKTIILAGIASITAGALAMAAGEYVSVSSQTDTEKADLKREKEELINDPKGELVELAKIYEQRGLSKKLALEVAKELTKHNALEAHARDELGIHEMTSSNPLQAAFASAASFIFGGALPVFVAFFGEPNKMVYLQYGFAVVFLAILGAISAKTGGANTLKAVLRITFWGTVAMLISAFIGRLFGVNIA